MLKMKRQLNHKIFVFVMLSTFLCGVVLFLFGFFPVGYHNYDQKGNSSHASKPISFDGHKIEPPRQIYDQIILIIIDALRFDYVNNLTMPTSFMNACSILPIQVSIPTVTMPRLKSLTTGTISNFIDIVLNLGHTEQLQDSLLHQLYNRGDLITFAGDHTWVNLFPNKFHRKAANLDSFFVNDFYEGDDNVTRALDVELQQDDWKFLILHYLGLDHIGHVEGTESDKIRPKLKEMDGVIEKIFQFKHFRKQMVLLTADHGMRNGGGHGGSTPEELKVPLLVFTERCVGKNTSLQEYNQIDIAATLAMLFSIEIPKASIGIIIPELLEDLWPTEQLYAHYYNAHHLIEKTIAKYGIELVRNEEYYQLFLKSKITHAKFLQYYLQNSTKAFQTFETAKYLYQKTMRVVSNELSQSLAGFHYDLIGIGLALTTLSTLYIIISVFLKDYNEVKYTLQCKQLLVCLVLAVGVNILGDLLEYFEPRDYRYYCLFTLSIAAIIYIIFDIFQAFKAILSLRYIKNTAFTLSMIMPETAFYIFYIMSLASSSFIERECVIWYYLGASIAIVQLFAAYGGNTPTYESRQLHWAFLIPITVGILRRYNIYFVVVLTNVHNLIMLSMLFAAGLLWLLANFGEFIDTRKEFLLSAIALFCVYCFRGINGAVCFWSMPSLSSVVLFLFWTSVFAVAALGCRSVLLMCRDNPYELKTHTMAQLLRKNLWCLLLIAALLHKPYNVVLLPAMLFMLRQFYVLYDRRLCTYPTAAQQLHVLMQKTFATIFVAKIFYFSQGNSNSLATIDLNPGYIGQTSYNPLIVTILVTLNTYGAPINAFLYFILHTISGNRTTIKSCRKASSSSFFLTHPISAGHSEQDMCHVAVSMYAAATLLPVAVYMWLLVLFRYHLFIYSVFAPKILYECYSVLVFCFVFALTNLYSALCQ